MRLGSWLVDMATRHYEGTDALSLLPAVWPAMGWALSSSGAVGYSYSLFREQVEVPQTFLDALGAKRLAAAEVELDALLAEGDIPKPVRLYISALKDAILADLKLLGICLQDLPLMVRYALHPCPLTGELLCVATERLAIGSSSNASTTLHVHAGGRRGYFPPWDASASRTRWVGVQHLVAHVAVNYAQPWCSYFPTDTLDAAWTGW